MTQDNAPEELPFDFDKFGFDKAIIKSIKKEGFKTPTPIQDLAISLVMGGSDLMGIAQTGSGKTAAFSLPVMNKLIDGYQKPESHKPKVLILAPTRELVMQIGKFIDTFSRGTPIRNLVVAGGQPYQPQIRKLKYGIDILISTPGRLIDHMGSGNVKLDHCHTFILDEADRMLDMGFIDDVKEVRQSLTEDHQTVMFSATMNEKVRRLSSELLKNPEYVEQERKTVVADTITHKLMNVRRKNKTDLLISILRDDTIDKALVFARTKLGADKLCDDLKRAFQDTPMRIDAIHGDKKQRTREKILANYRKGRTKVLVATDVAARGIDVDGITHVINYELPIEAENYVHRVGRTGRAGETGIAISFCDPSDMRLLKEIERLIKIKVEVDEDQKYHFEMSATNNFKDKKRGKFSRNRNDKKRGERSSRPERNSRKPANNSRRGDNDNKPGQRNSEDRAARPRYDKKPGTRNAEERTAKPRYDKKPNERLSKDRNTANKKPYDNKTEQKTLSRSKSAPRKYDPLKDDYKFDSSAFEDDPVLQKLRGKPVKRKTTNDVSGGERKPTKPAVNKKGNPKRPKKAAATFKGKKQHRNTKQTGGHKTFTPKRRG